MRGTYSSLSPPSPVAFTKLFTMALLVGFGIKPSKNLEVGLMRAGSITLGVPLNVNCVRGQVLVGGQAGFTESGSKILGRRTSEKSPPRSASVGTVVVNTVPWRKAKDSQLKKKKSFSLTAAPPNVAPY